MNGYPLACDLERSGIILVNSCCVTEEKIAASLAAPDITSAYVNARRRGRDAVISDFNCTVAYTLLPRTPSV